MCSWISDAYLVLVNSSKTQIQVRNSYILDTILYGTIKKSKAGLELVSIVSFIKDPVELSGSISKWSNSQNFSTIHFHVSKIDHYYIEYNVDFFSVLKVSLKSEGQDWYKFCTIQLLKIINVNSELKLSYSAILGMRSSYRHMLL